MVYQRWYDDRVEKYVNDKVIKLLDKSAFIVEGEIKRTITDMELVDTGRYRSNIQRELIPGKLIARVGSDIDDPPYPLFLELGTVKMKAYAPMRTGLANSKSRVEAAWR